MHNYIKYYCLLLFLLVSSQSLESNAKTVRINPSHPLAEQLITTNTKYIIKRSVDLRGETILIPENSVLVIKRGTVSNGAIIGNKSFITLRRNCLDNVTIGDGVISTTKKVKSSYYKSNDYELLKSLCNICPNEGVVLLDKDVEYVLNKPINVKQSISIKGNNHILKLKNPDNCAITAFDVKELSHFSLSELTIDGSWNSNRSHGKYTDQYLLDIVSVDTVTIKKCEFRDAMVTISNWREKEAGFIRIYDFKHTQFVSNKIINCHTNEGLLVRNDDFKKGNAIISDNLFGFVYTSSCVNAYYGKYIVKNNVFGTCRGSALNLFGYDSEIVGNTFKGSHFSCAIDLSESGLINYPSHDVLIKDNKVFFCYSGFVCGHNISNVDIINNDYNCSLIQQPELMDNYDSVWGRPKNERKTDKVFNLSGSLNDIKINGNRIVGGNTLLFIEDNAFKKNITIEKNRVELYKSTFRSAIVFNSVDGLFIKENEFYGSGCTPGYIGKPVFFATLPINESVQAISNVKIEKNSFYSGGDTCYIFAQSIYDRNKEINFLPIRNFEVVNNKSDISSSLIFVNEKFSFSNEPTIRVKNNSFNGGVIISNTSVDTDMVEITKNESLKTDWAANKEYRVNTVVQYEGKKYFVVAGGKTSKPRFEKKNNNYIRNGEVILHAME